MKVFTGEIWLALIPVISYDENKNLTVKLQKRPCLIIDNGSGLIVEGDSRNYHILKLTTQNDPYSRKLIKNWKKIGLKKKSYVRIELPIKLEEDQLDRKITKLSPDVLVEMYAEIYSILNIKALEQMVYKLQNDNKILKDEIKVNA